MEVIKQYVVRNPLNTFGYNMIIQVKNEDFFILENNDGHADLSPISYSDAFALINQ